MGISDLFLSKNKKLVKRWRAEHEKIVELANKVIAEYVKNNTSGAKSYMRSLSSIAADHLASEDIEFYKLLRDPERNDEVTRDRVKEFEQSFKDIKPTLQKFLAKYSKDETPLDDEFFDTFNKIVEVLTERIDYEERNLYLRMSLS